MGNLFLTIAALAVAYLPIPEPIPPPVGVAARLALILAASVAYVLLGSVIARRSVRRYRLGTPSAPREYVRTLVLYRILLIAVYGLQIHALRWIEIAGPEELDQPFLLRDALLLGPFVLTLLASWVPFYRVDRYLRGPAWTLRSYLSFQIRSALMLGLGPLAIVLAVLDGLPRIPGVERLFFLYPFLLWATLIALLLVLFAISPFLLRLLWSARPLPQGPLRDALEQLFRHAHFRCSDILVWPTGNAVTNAAIAGVLPSIRYVLMTDAIIRNLETHELCSVMAHEIGHAKHRHLVLYFFIAIGYMCLAILADTLTRPYIDRDSWIAVLPNLILLVVYWPVVFRSISYSCEHDADAFATEMTGGSPLFIHTLSKVSLLSGRDPSTGTLLHPSTNRRAAFLESARSNKFVLHRLRRRLRFVALGFAVLVAATSLAMYEEVREQVDNAPARGRIYGAFEIAVEGEAALSGGCPEEAARRLRQAIAMDPHRRFYYLLLGRALRQLGEEDLALRNFRIVARLGAMP